MQSTGQTSMQESSLMQLPAMTYVMAPTGYKPGKPGRISRNQRGLPRIPVCLSTRRAVQQVGEGPGSSAIAKCPPGSSIASMPSSSRAVWGGRRGMHDLNGGLAVPHRCAVGTGRGEREA
jgi:hypothetical protein